ncbi:MAG: hypothetical protein GWP41_00860 [Planctomycetia bacterium]|nr:hypothetical protein [Planctomycetia bacterium]
MTAKNSLNSGSFIFVSFMGITIPTPLTQQSDTGCVGLRELFSGSCTSGNFGGVSAREGSPINRN